MLQTYSLELTVAGTDEAGRGCLAGPVTAAAIILPHNFENELLNDSKQVNKENRDQLRKIIEQECICFGVAHVFMEDIDKINILNASILAMHKALEKLSQHPECIIVDGNRFKPFGKIPYECVIKGDGKFKEIAAASILAKTYRDSYMEKIHKEFPVYNWKKNKGYPTVEHRNAIREHGPSLYHRKSFRLLPEQLSIDF